ncbi:MAG: ABC transporter permease [Bacteroidetes bacterium]|nr:ABC transporter permease [Bacteroidota bacterium]
MLKNYLKTAYRSLSKNRFYSLINVTGLAVGIASCLLIVLFVIDELSYDKFHEKSERIYRIEADIMFGGNHFEMPVAPAPMAQTIMDDYPEVEIAGRFRRIGSHLFKKEINNIKEDNVSYADNNIFEIFTITFIYGDMATALEKPNTMIISKTVAEKHFGFENPIGLQMTMDNDELYEVTGVFEELPVNSHFHLDVMLSMEGLDDAKNTTWLGNNYFTYFVLREDADPAAFQEKMVEMVNTYTFPQVEQLLNITIENFEASGQWVRYNIRPVTDIHLHSNLGFEFEPTGDIKYVYIFSAIAAIILLIACINFMNLSTARSANRAKEVGVRKVLGSYRSHLMLQFLTESILLSMLGMVIALILASLALPYFNQLANKSLSIPYTSPVFLLGIIGGAIVIGVLAGIYPAFFLSAFRPAAVLKGRLNLGVKSGWLRSSLVVIQFTASIILIVGTLVIYRQLNFIQNKKLGFNKEQVILVEDVYALDDNIEVFKNQILQNSNVLSATITSFLPVSSSRSDSGFWPEGEQPDELNSVSMQVWRVDHDYIPTMGMEIIEGRNFSIDFPSDSTGIIINERAAQLFGYDNPIGKKVFTFDDFGPDNDPSMSGLEIVGIVKNFNYESLHENIGALSMYLGSSRRFACFRISTADVSVVISDIEARWKDLGPGQPFQYSFLDDRFAQMYDAERRVGRIAMTFSFLAIFVASLGLFGLAAFTAEQRTKEIGVRKVMGASVASIVFLLSKEFGKLILIALAFAIPVSWYFMNGWLQDFHFRITIGPGVFLIAAGITLLIAWVTMSWQSIKAAIANPVDSLKDE